VCGDQPGGGAALTRRPPLAQAFRAGGPRTCWVPGRRGNYTWCFSLSLDPVLNPYVAPQLEFDSDDEPDDPTFHDDWVHHVSRPDPSEAHLVPPDPLSEDELMSYEVPLPEGPAIAGAVIRGRLRARYNAWREIGANGQVLNWIRHGYRIPFEGVPPPPYRCGRTQSRGRRHPPHLVRRRDPGASGDGGRSPLDGGSTTSLGEPFECGA
jgi:hypothetical protein